MPLFSLSYKLSTRALCHPGQDTPNRHIARKWLTRVCVLEPVSVSFLSSELRGVRLERSMGPGVDAEQERNKQRRKSQEGEEEAG